MARLALLALLTGAAAFVSKRAPAPRAPRRRAPADARRHGHGGHVLGGRGAAVLRARATSRTRRRPPRPDERHLPPRRHVPFSASQLGAPLTAATVNPLPSRARSACRLVGPTSRRGSRRRTDPRRKRARAAARLRITAACGAGCSSSHGSPLPRRPRRLAGAERGSRVLQGAPNAVVARVRAAEHAPR